MAVIYALAVYVLPGLNDTSNGQAVGDPLARQSGKCIKRHQVLVRRGEHNAHLWSVVASIEADHDCGAWLLGMEFIPQGEVPGSWKGAWEIPAGGHLPNSATMDARDEATGEDRDVSGVVGWRVRSVVFTTKMGRTIVVHPKVPVPTLRRHFSWLQNLRYFLRFYPKGDPVKVAKLLDKRGKVISVIEGRLGGFEGNMVY